MKPWQQRNNYEYPYSLIRRGLNEDFIIDIELGFLSVDHEAGRLRNTSEFSGVTLLEYACQWGNEELIRYILSKKPASVKKCIYHLPNNREMIQLLLDAGADINEPHRYHGTVLACKISRLQEFYAKGAPQRMIEDAKSMIAWLIAHGADPYVKDRMGNDALYPASLLPETQGMELIRFVKAAFEKVHRG